jgi:hypothetical protein
MLSIAPAMHALREVDDESWPFVVSVMPAAPDEDFFLRYFERQRAMFQRKERWVHLVDTRAVVKLPDPRVRHVITSHTDELTQLSRQFNVGTAVVIAHALVRGIMTALHWVSPPRHPFSVVATPAEACEYLAQCCRRAGMTPPANMNETRVNATVVRAIGTMKG